MVSNFYTFKKNYLKGKLFSSKSTITKNELQEGKLSLLLTLLRMNEFSKVELEHRFLTCQVSGVLTLLHTLHTFNPALAEQHTLVIHVPGASVYEMMGLIKWECKNYNLRTLPPS